MKKEILILGIICLFIGVGIQPAFAVEPAKKSNSIGEEDTEPKDYLFQTIIDIANNPDVKDLLGQYENDLFKVDIDKSVYRKILFRNPRLLFNMFLTKPSFTPEYLDSIYNQGCQIINILGEDEAKKITESVTYNNPEFFNELINILFYNEGLSNRMEILSEMNKDLNNNLPFEDYPIICAFLAILLFMVLINIAIMDGMFILIGVVISKLPDIFMELYGYFIMLYVFFSFFVFLAVVGYGVQLECWAPIDPLT
jgi:hypothetical protein